MVCGNQECIEIKIYSALRLNIFILLLNGGKCVLILLLSVQ